MGKNAEEEQAVETSEEEKSEESSEPANVEEAVERFTAEKAKESSVEAEETETEEKAAEKEEGTEEEKPKEATLFILDAKGKKHPFIVKADGKDHFPESVETALQWTGLGIHGNAKTAEINKEREAFEKAKPFLDAVQKAHEEGRLVIDGKPTKEVSKEGTEEESEEEEFVDPELKIRDDKILDLQKKEKVRGEEEIKRQITEAKTKIDGEIEGFSAESFAAINIQKKGAPVGVWDLLGQKEADGKTLKYKTVGEAMKASHDITIAFVKNLIKEHPKEFDIDEDHIYAKVLKKKQEGEEEHVGAPSILPAGDESKSEEEEPQTAAEGMDMFMKTHKAKIAAAAKS